MKRTFKRPDGTEEVFEGTAEELAEYERKLNEQTKPPAKPDVLHGATLDGVDISLAEIDFLRSWRKLITSPDTFRVPTPYQTEPFQPIVPWQPMDIPTIQPLGPWPGYPWYTITCTSDHTLPIDPKSTGVTTGFLNMPSISEVLMGASFTADTNPGD